MSQIYAQFAYTILTYVVTAANVKYAKRHFASTSPWLVVACTIQIAMAIWNVWFK